MRTDLKIVGCGGHFKVVLDALLLAKHPYQITLCDNAIAIGTLVKGFVVDSTLENLHSFKGLVHISIGNNLIRKEVYKAIESYLTPLIISHPKAIISISASIGSGSFIAANALLGPDCIIGEGCIINHGAIVDHDVTVGAFSHIAPNSTLGGKVTIGDGVLVGAGAVILPGLRIGDGATIAAGAVVIKDVKSNTMVKGVPAG